MRIDKIDNNLNYKSGLNKNVIQYSSHAEISRINKDLANINIKTDFESCNTVAYLIWSTINLLNTLKKKTRAKLFDIFAPEISVYIPENLNFKFTGKNFCVPETQIITKNNKSYKTGSLLFEKNDNIEILNAQLDKSYSKKERSTAHYLSPFIHEFMHGIYLNYVYKKYGYEGFCDYTKQKYFLPDKENTGLKVLQKLQSLTFSKQENEIIEDTIGKYATTTLNQYHELFAETFTKLICDSLSEKGIPYKNPIDLLRQLPIEYLQILQKIFI